MFQTHLTIFEGGAAYVWIAQRRSVAKVWTYRSTFLLGLLNTVETAFFALILAFALGIIFGLMATCGNKILRGIARVSMWN